MANTLREGTLRTPAVTLSYAEGPATGRPLVLLHGGSARWQAFESIIPGLAADYHLCIPDLRGHGRSGWTPGHYTLRDFAGDIVAFLREVVAEPAALFGHSLGGIVARLLRRPTHRLLADVGNVLHNQDPQAVLLAVAEYLRSV